MKVNIALLVSWNLHKDSSGKYYISNTHWNYLLFLSSKFSKIYLIGTTKDNKEIVFPNIEIVKLPAISGYANAQTKVITYYKVIKSISPKVDLFYCRVPDPFSWMPALFFNKKCIMHFVGDTIDATNYNESWWKKRIMIAGYYPDYLLTILAAKRNMVYTNGFHIAKRLKKFSIKSIPVISSTISEKVFNDNLPDLIHRNLPISLIYVGYIRYAKGINCLMHLCKKLNEEDVDFRFDIVGAGEMFEDLKKFVCENNLSNRVILYGYIDDKKALLQKIRESDLFFFPSLSEGSPRVVIEAMSQGIPVLTTPVGALPTTFEDCIDIRFFDFDDYNGAFSIIKEYENNRSSFVMLRDKAYIKVKENYTIEAFLGKVFSV